MAGVMTQKQPVAERAKNTNTHVDDGTTTYEVRWSIPAVNRTVRINVDDQVGVSPGRLTTALRQCIEDNYLADAAKIHIDSVAQTNKPPTDKLIIL